MTWGAARADVVVVGACEGIFQEPPKQTLQRLFERVSSECSTEVNNKQTTEIDEIT